MKTKQINTKTVKKLFAMAKEAITIIKNPGRRPFPNKPLLINIETTLITQLDKAYTLGKKESQKTINDLRRTLENLLIFAEGCDQRAYDRSWSVEKAKMILNKLNNI